ncbi:hypothetical protein FACHB389_10835 [Nostoc calcicola FACHB-389]|nr:hypothetical protein [Nostoc calcicola FACHB-3891]OKH36745.1 hypothetical protein FACHB389_10835 [Nostoc calcicola FACHB-389]
MSRSNFTQYSAKSDPFVQNFLARVPRETAAKFTNTQLTELKRVLSNKVVKYHAVDIRLSIPFLKQRFYVVFLIGKEKRLNKRPKSAIFTFANRVVFIISFLLLIASLIGVFQIIKKVSNNDYLNTIHKLQQYLNNKI